MNGRSVKWNAVIPVTCQFSIGKEKVVNLFAGATRSVEAPESACEAPFIHGRPSHRVAEGRRKGHDKGHGELVPSKLKFIKKRSSVFLPVPQVLFVHKSATLSWASHKSLTSFVGFAQRERVAVSIKVMF
jgi:hypothetical protein